MQIFNQIQHTGNDLLHYTHKTQLHFGPIYFKLEYTGYCSLTSDGRSAFPSAHNCQGQLQTPQSVTVLFQHSVTYPNTCIFINVFVRMPSVAYKLVFLVTKNWNIPEIQADLYQKSSSWYNNKYLFMYFVTMLSRTLVGKGNTVCVLSSHRTCA